MLICEEVCIKKTCKSKKFQIVDGQGLQTSLCVYSLKA